MLEVVSVRGFGKSDPFDDRWRDRFERRRQGEDVVDELDFASPSARADCRWVRRGGMSENCSMSGSGASESLIVEGEEGDAGEDWDEGDKVIPRDAVNRLGLSGGGLCRWEAWSEAILRSQ